MPTDTQTLPALSFTYQEWMRDTSRTGLVRSAELKKLDGLIESYTRLPSADKLTNLKNTFSTWKAGHGLGQQWTQSHRNRSSAVTRLDADLKGMGDSDAGMGRVSFMADDMANARLGLLYLFSGVTCKTDKFSIVTNGAIDMTGGALGFTGDTLENIGFQDAAKSMPVAKTLFKMGSDKTLKTRETRRRIKSQQLLQGKAPVLPDNKLTRDAHEKVSDAAYRIASDVYRDIKKKLWDGDSATTARHELPGSARVVCNILGAHFVKDAVPFFSGGMSVANGLVNAIYAGHARYNEYSHGKNISVLPGYTTDIVREIRRAMEVNTCAGMYEALKGGTKMAVEGLTSGAGSPVTSLVFALVEAIVTTTWRFYDIDRMTGFFAKAHEEFIIREQPMALHHRPMEFSRWFRKNAVGTPALSMLALNSGLCGDKMRFLNMYDGTEHQIAPRTSEGSSRGPTDAFKESAKRFAAATNYVDELKVYGALYLEEVGYEFDSGDDLIKSCIALQDIPAEGIKRAVHPNLVAGNWSRRKSQLRHIQKFISPEA